MTTERGEARESDIQRAVLAHWKTLGMPRTLVAAIPNQFAHGQPGLTAGLPDLLVLAPGFVGFIELKRDKGKLSTPQAAFKAFCDQIGVPARVCYGRDEPIAVLEEWNVVRSAR